MTGRIIAMSNDSFEFIQLTWVDDVAVITLLHGEDRTLCSSWEQLREELNSFVAAHDFADVVVDFRNVHQINTPVKSDLTSAAVRANRDGIKWRFCGMTEPIRSLYKMSNFEPIIPIHESRSEALAAFIN